ncbi:hypothetical protein DIURU_002477 [Diutina rugosa]|uniref:Brl1/Brr6 domain-containing protein n=1 Tax=Diutina rugosa TaxID=5481 RepID=A0A642UQ87_DIURU|nr:uncharacterized protein DIURU_002477 [Diutina rugosa]KAA8903315.1 hypothetical protein DIURU_002477 [Diutina rugosa]
MSDDVTQILNSLSISNHDADDYMDIDDMFDSVGVNTGPDHHHSTAEPEVEEPPTPSQRKLSLSTITSTIKSALSPTELGARIAMKKPLLLMPPPSAPSRRSSVTEVDTSQGVVSRRPGYHNEDSDVEMEMLSAPAAANPSWGTSSGVFNPISLNNRNFAPMPMVPTGDSKHYFEIHHHVHYSGQQQQHQQHHQHQQLQHQHQQLQHQHQQLQQQQHQVVPHNGISATTHERITQPNLLPVPWSQTAAPIDPTFYKLSSYVQLAFNVMMALGISVVVGELIRRFHNDVTARVEALISEATVTVDLCNQQYIRDCVESKIVPATQKYCAELNRCRQRDPKAAAQYTSQLAMVFGELLASFVRPFGFKVYVMVFLVCLAFVGNFGFGYLRAKTYYGDVDERVGEHT